MFRVWAPEHHSVDLVLYSSAGARQVESVRPLEAQPDGYWAGTFADVGPGALYKYRLDRDEHRTFPDPASRFQPAGVHGPSAVIDPERFAWSDRRWQAPPLHSTIFYELHIGTFTPEGTFRAAMSRLEYLADLGVTAIELMPIADFPGDRNWGYDGVALFAPARCYGSPDDFRAFVDAAHRLGLAVFLDVVYNHLGPDGAYANAFSPYYFTDAHRSPWGRGVNLDGPHSREVRRLFIENALHWVNEYHVDGLRLDATHALQDDSPVHFLAELSSTVTQSASRPVTLVAEDHRNLTWLVQPVRTGGMGLDGVWADDFHHEVRVHVAHDREGYYADYTGTAADLAATIRRGWFFTGQYSSHLHQPRGTPPTGVAPWQCIICIQNHDQVGNRADGARLHHQIDAATYRAISTLLLLAPETPLLFMGQEWATHSPFLFFTDHHAELGRQVTEGRRREFDSFAAFTHADLASAVPDPQALETFERSRLRWDEQSRSPHTDVLRLYRRLIALRRSIPALHRHDRGARIATALDEHTVAIAYDEAGLVVIARLSGPAASVRVSGFAGDAISVFTTEASDVTGSPLPIALHASGEGLRVEFKRPGAVVLRGPALARTVCETLE